jgi:hypothetical protein
MPVKASKSRKSKKTGARRGRKNTFSDAKFTFLDSFKDEFISTEDPSAFYTNVTQAFIDTFGYDLAIGKNPPEALGTDFTSLAPKPVDPTLSAEKQKAENERRSQFNDSLRTVRFLS